MGDRTSCTLSLGGEKVATAAAKAMNTEALGWQLRADAYAKTHYGIGFDDCLLLESIPTNMKAGITPAEAVEHAAEKYGLEKIA